MQVHQPVHLINIPMEFKDTCAMVYCCSCLEMKELLRTARGMDSRHSSLEGTHIGILYVSMLVC